jgi:diaminopimelate epimerase
MVDRFHKMHGLGNDFVIIDARNQAMDMPAGKARAIADRRTGIGCDQLIVLLSSRVADARMRIFNADGGEVEACGNAARAVGVLLKTDAAIETLGGIIHTTSTDESATVDMGLPRFEWEAIPLAYAMDTINMPVGWDGLETPVTVNIGNPHVIFFVTDSAAIDLEHLGPLIENDPLFPERVNVNVAQVLNPSQILLRVWERGVGITRACGTGACATAVAAIRTGRATSPVTVTLPGGDLQIAWSSGSPVSMSGPATYVFEGQTDWSLFG